MFDYKMPKKVPRQVYRRVDRDIGHPSGGLSIPNNRGRLGGVFREITGRKIP